jgi:hypothetical protein
MSEPSAEGETLDLAVGIERVPDGWRVSVVGLPTGPARGAVRASREEAVIDAQRWGQHIKDLLLARAQKVNVTHRENWELP